MKNQILSCLIFLLSITSVMAQQESSDIKTKRLTLEECIAYGLENNLISSRFMRIHHSFINSLDKITSIEKGQLIIAGDRCITIADLYKDKFQSYLNAMIS
ncbi:MAG: hypothetical protein ACOYN5_12080 [Bacteroidales bacterium]